VVTAARHGSSLGKSFPSEAAALRLGFLTLLAILAPGRSKVA